MKKNGLNEQYMNNYFIPYKIRPVSEKNEIVLIFTLAFMNFDS